MKILVKFVDAASADDVLDMLAPALPEAVAEFEAGAVFVRAWTLEVKVELLPAFSAAELPIPLTVTSLLSDVAAGDVPELFALNEPEITPLEASCDAEEELYSRLARSVTAVTVEE